MDLNLPLRLFILALIVIGLYSCSGDSYQVTRIDTGHGPEDMALDLGDTANPRIIISCSKRKGKDSYGKIQYYDIKTEAIKDFDLIGYNESDIRPHGICIQPIDSLNYLYVISHEANSQEDVLDKILKFEIGQERLTFIHQWTSEQIPIMDATNDLVVDEAGRIYCTNPTKVGFKKVPAKVALIHPDGSYKSIIDGLFYPNGIYLDDNHLYVATAQGNILYKYQLDEDGKPITSTVEEAAKIKGGDNITRYNDKLVIANHPSLVKFVMHRYFGSKSPSSVYTYDIETGASYQIFGPNSKYISASSTALIYDDQLYISQVFENYIIRTSINKLEI